MAIQMTYDSRNENAKAYKDYLTKNAAKFGLTPEQIEKIPNPVLVHQVGDDADVNAIINSTEGGARLGSSEQAKVDADKLKQSTLEKFVDNGKGEILNPGNRSFLRAAVQDIKTDTDANTFFTDNGQITQQGAERVRNALFAKAYNDSYILARMSEATDSNSKNVLKAMIAAAPKVAKVNDGIKNGEVYPEYDVSKVITDSVKKLMSLRDANKPLDFYLNENSLFDEENSEENKAMLKFMDGNKFKVREMAELFNGLADRAFAMGNPAQGNMFGDMERPTMVELIKNTIKDIKGRTGDLDYGQEYAAQGRMEATESTGSGQTHRPETQGMAAEGSTPQNTERTVVDEGTQTSESGENPQHNDENAEPQQTQAAEGAEASESKQNTNKVELAPGYKTSSGKPLSEADKDDFIIKPDGSMDFGYIMEEIEKATNGELKKAPIRLKVGDVKQGLIHAKRHEKDAHNIGYSSIEALVSDVAEHFDSIYVKDNGEGKRPTYTLVKHGDIKNGKKHVVTPVYFNLEKQGDNYYVVITTLPKGERELNRQIKKEHLIYSSQGLDATGTPNGTPVSVPANNSVGVGQDRLPTSDKSSVPSTTNVAQGQEEVNGVDNAKLAPYRDAVARIMSQLDANEITEPIATEQLKKVMVDANSASQGQFEAMGVVKGTQDQLTHEEMVAAQKIANDALGKVHEAQAAEQFVNAIRKVMDLYQNKEIDRERAWELLHSIDGGIQAKNLEGNKALGDYFADSLKLLGQGSVEEEQNLQDAQFDSMESHEGTGFHEAFHVAHDMVLTDKEKALLDTHIGDEEAQVDHYAAWVEARKKGRGTAWGKLWQKIQDFARKMQAILTRTENVHNVLRKIESGDVWSRTAEDLQQENKKFAVTNKEITAETRVPVIDVTGQRMVNVDDKEEKKKIAQSLMGQTFKIIGSNGIGRISSMKMGEHFVNSSNHKLRKDPSRRRALSIAEKVLNNAVYVEKHDDVRHHTDVKYIELFTRIRDGNTTSTFRIVAREGDKNTGEYEIKDVKFYDIIKEEDSSTVATVPNSRKGISTANTSTTDVHQQNESSSDTVSVAELLQGVKDW